jgi:hypothetical protein
VEEGDVPEMLLWELWECMGHNPEDNSPDSHGLENLKYLMGIELVIIQCSFYLKKKKQLHGLSPQANYTDRATAVCRRS